MYRAGNGPGPSMELVDHKVPTNRSTNIMNMHRISIKNDVAQNFDSDLRPYTVIINNHGTIGSKVHKSLAPFYFLKMSVIWVNGLNLNPLFT